MAIPYDKEMRERAQAKDEFLFQVSLDGKYLSKKTRDKLRGKVFTGRFQSTGPMSHAAAMELWEWLLKWQKKRNGYATKR